MQLLPNARILFIEANSGKRKDLMDAVTYANTRSDVVAISMSWGNTESSKQLNFDSDFNNAYGATYFAASGDSGTGAIWPATAPNVVSVGGTTLNFNSNGVFTTETAWNGSGGGLSTIETEPSYQVTYGVPQANGMRANPDVSFDGDPNSGVAVYDSIPFAGVTGWAAAGGTSVGTPIWAGIRALGGGKVNNVRFYQDAATKNYSKYFRDITSGTNGTCGFYCTAGLNYDYVTGLGSPLTVSY